MPIKVIVPVGFTVDRRVDDPSGVKGMLERSEPPLTGATFVVEADAGTCACGDPTWRWDCEMCSRCGDKLVDPRDAEIASLRAQLAAANGLVEAERALGDALVNAVLKFGDWDIGTRVGDAIAAIESARANRTT